MTKSQETLLNEEGGDLNLRNNLTLFTVLFLVTHPLKCLHLPEHGS